MGTYAGANAWQAAGQGLRNIGRIVAERRTQDEERRRQAMLDDQRLGEFVTERGGGMGPVPQMPGTPSTPGTMTPESRVGALDADINIVPPIPGTPAGPDPRYVALGNRGYVMRPELRPDAVLAAERSQRENRELDARTGLWQAQTAQAEANAGRYGRMPTYPGGGVPRDRPTIPQAMDILRRRYGRWDDTAKDYSYSVPFDQMYAEARQMAQGGEMRPGDDPGVTPPPSGPPIESGWLLRPPPGQAPSSGAPSVPGAGATRAPIVPPLPSGSVRTGPPVLPSPAMRGTVPPVPRGNGASSVGRVAPAVPPTTTARTRISADQADFLRTVRHMTDAEIAQRYEIVR